MSTLTKSIVEAFNVLMDIGGESSTKAKQEILSKNQDNEVLRTLLFSAYNPFLQYNLKKIPISMSSCNGTEINDTVYDEFLKLLVKLSKREVTGNQAVEEVSSFLEKCSAPEYAWYTRVIQKDLKIGLADKGINKAIKDLIPVYEVLLADKIPADGLNLDTPKVLKMLPDRMVTQYKIDGYRLNIHVTEDGVTIRTRNGKVVEGYSDLENEALNKLPKGFVYDGEIVAPELLNWIAENSKNESSEVIANRDLFSEVMSHAFSKEENKQGVFNLFDMIPVNEWQTQKTALTYEDRLKNIENLIKPLELKHITIVPTSRVYLKSNPDDLKEIVDQFHYFLSIGWEGLMIKNLDAPYEFKRSKSLLKMKLMDTIDLVVQDVFEGLGKYENKLGGVIVEYKGNEVRVGSGWTDEQRELYWKDPNSIIGKTIEIAYQAESQNKQGGKSLSFPVIKRVRDDK